VAISSKLLPPGIMGVMIASMFAATMSSQNSDYNVIASVLSKDVYQRLINNKATDKQMLTVAKLSTVLVGALVLIGGLFIKDFGGAFEANKLFTGIFAIPIGVALVLGIINKRATSKGALYTVILGSIAGIVLNSIPTIFTWEMATLIEIILCLFIFYGSALSRKRNQFQSEKVVTFFNQLNNKISDIPTIDSKFKSALFVLYVASLGASGILFISMGIASINQLSGILTVASGLICLLMGAVLYIFKKGKLE